MKKLFLGFLLVMFGFVKSKDNELKSKVILVEELNIKTEFFDKIRITRDSSLIAGSFDSLTFIKNGKVVYALKNNDGYDSLQYVFNGIKNISKSKLIFATQSANQYLITLFGFEYGCCPRNLTLLIVDKKGFKKIFDDEFDVSEISLLNVNTFLINGQESFSQGIMGIDSTKTSVGSYSPHLIYLLSNKLELDSTRTKEWNEKNYIFKGFKGDGDIWIAEHFKEIKNGNRFYVFKEKGDRFKQ